MKFKKRVFHEGDELVCVTDRYVVSWGYAYEYKDALKEFSDEAGIVFDKTVFLNSVEERLFELHPAFLHCREKFYEFEGVLAEARSSCLRGVTPRCDDKPTLFGAALVVGGQDDSLKKAMKRYVRGIVYDHLRRKMKDGNARRIVFGNIQKHPNAFRVLELRTIQTGVYYPSETWEDSEGYVDGESAGLRDRETHRLVRVASAEGTFSCDPPVNDYMNYNIWLLAKDCIHVKEVEITERLRGEPIDLEQLRKASA